MDVKLDSETNTIYTNGQYGCSVKGKTKTEAEMDEFRHYGTIRPERKTHKSHYSNDFVIFRRENLDGKCN
ncbi:hypothetical protein pVa21_177 [Vibrio phage pVa-21]|nr:hypothetical protein pVa21_177 [Vibrio phage pVa-21]